MVSVVIATDNCERALLPTLSALVAGAAAGVVRDVTVADAGSKDGTVTIADAAGCRVISAPAAPAGARMKAAAAAARSGWLLFLPAGVVPGPGWVAEVARFVEQGETEGSVRAAMFRRGGSDAMRPAVTDALLQLHAALFGKPRPEQGLLIARCLYDALGGHRDARDGPEADLLRRLGRRRLVLLRCSAGVAG